MDRRNPELTIELLTQAALAFAALAFYMAMLAALAGCNPYADLYPSRTPAPSVTATSGSTTVEPLEITPTPRPSCVVSTNVPLGYLNLRSGPGTQFAVIGLLREGDTLTMTGEARAGWVVVIAGNLEGWVNGRYCEVIR